MLIFRVHLFPKKIRKRKSIEILSTKFEIGVVLDNSESGIPVSFYDFDAFKVYKEILGRGTCNEQDIIVFEYDLNSKTQNLPVYFIWREVRNRYQLIFINGIGIESGRLKNYNLMNGLIEWGLLVLKC